MIPLSYTPFLKESGLSQGEVPRGRIPDVPKPGSLFHIDCDGASCRAEAGRRRDTPGYGAWDLPDFRDFHQKPDHSAVQRASRSRHLNGTMADAARALPIAVQDVAAPNGNSVSIETEMLKGVEAQRQHSRALAIYKSALGVLRSTIKT